MKKLSATPLESVLRVRGKVAKRPTSQINPVREDLFIPNIGQIHNILTKIKGYLRNVPKKKF
jgi:hypothetical protein